MSVIQKISGGTHHHYYNLTQQELSLETKKECTFRTYPKLIAHLEARAKREGISRSLLIEKLVIRSLKAEEAIKTVHANLDAIVTKYF